MFSRLRTSLWGAVGFGAAGLLLIAALDRPVAADPPAGPDLLAPPNPEAAPPALPPVGGAAPLQAGEEEGEVQTRGAIHEAFAEPFDKDPKPTVVVPRQPPEPINEIAPDVKPEGENVAWIPGYWGWDDERQDFVWISGLWRVVPPGRRWVPGYWDQTEGGFRWINGMWAEDRVEELSYLPDPPASQEIGPNSPVPSPDHFWIPGCWIYGNSGYAWRAGYWSPGYDNWMWVPARYVWTPRGCYFVPGYWDYALARRGVLFSPVYFRAGVYARPRFAFSPSVVVSIGGVSSHLFVGVGFGHYYFGDYYGDACLRRGYYPWHVYHRQRCFDPCLNYYAWYHRRHDKYDYVRRLEDRHDHFAKHADLRPPKTYLAQRDWERRVGEARVRETGELGRSLRDVQNRPDRDNVKFVKVADVQRREIDENRSQIRNLSTQRSKLERAAGDARVRGNVARGGDGKGPGAVGRPGEVRVPADRDSVRRGAAGAGDAARSDAARLKLPKPTGAEQRAAIDRSRVNVPADAARRGGEAFGADGPRDAGSRGEAVRRGVTSGDRTPGSDQRPSLSRDGQPRDSQPRTIQPRDTQPRDSQPRTVQPRESQPRESQPRESQPRIFQPRDSQPRESQPRSFQPRESQPRGGGSGSRESQPRGGSGGGRDRSGRSAISEDAPAIVKDAKPPVATKPREPVVAGKKEEAKPPTVVVRPRPAPQTRLKLATEPPSGGADTTVPRSTRSTPLRTDAPKTVPPPTGRSSRLSGEAGSSPPRSRGSASESRNSRTESSESKAASKEKEEEEKKSSSGRGRGR